MAKYIKSIVDRVNFATKKGLTGYHTPEQITAEVHAESMNVWRKYMEAYRETKILDVLMRPFQVQEVVQLTNGLGILDSQDVACVGEGIVPANLTKAQISTNAYGIGSHVLVLGGTQGQYQWLEVYTATSSPATVTLALDGTVIFRGQITNKHVFIPFLYLGQINIAVTVADQSVTVNRHSIAITGNNTEIEMVEDEEFKFRASHPIKTPTADYPVANILKQVITVLPPAAFNFIVMTIIKRPTKPVYAYTTSGTRYIYDDANSVDYEWHETIHDAIQDRVLSNLGINIRSAEMIQYAASQRKMEEARI